MLKFTVGKLLVKSSHRRKHETVTFGYINNSFYSCQKLEPWMKLMIAKEFDLKNKL